MTPLDVLKNARDLILDPEHWTQGAAARDRSGNELCLSEVDRGVCFCPVGALRFVSPRLLSKDPFHISPSLHAKRVLEKFLPRDFDSVEDFNDDEATTHAEVVEAFNRAIAAEEAACPA